MFQNATRKRSSPTKNEIIDATHPSSLKIFSRGVIDESMHLHESYKPYLAKLVKPVGTKKCVPKFPNCENVLEQKRFPGIDFQRPPPKSSHPNSSSHQPSHFHKRTLGYGYGTIDNMVDSQNHALSENIPYDEGGNSSCTDRSAGKPPLEFEASTQRQRRTSKSIRLYAISLCVAVALGAAFACLSNGSIDAQLASSPASRSSLVDDTNKQSAEKKAYRIPKVQQPKRLEEDPEHETMIQKLRDEFHEWVEHHSRDYGSDEEKEKRFHIWKENHFR